MANSLFSFDESKLEGYNYLIGTDEAGRGPGAGPVFSAAVCFPKIDKKIIKTLNKVNDSKKLNEKTREELFVLIQANSIFHISSASVEEIAKINILQASLLSMKRACDEVIKKLENNNVKLLIDGNKLIPKYACPQEYVIKGDSKSAAIAAASILAKVSRDRFMKELSIGFPEYKWEQNKGYLTPEHLRAIDKYGMTIWHRKKFLEKHFNNYEQTSIPLLLQK